MRPFVLDGPGAVGQSDVYPLDYEQSAPRITLQLVVAAATTVTVQGTCDPDPRTATNWFGIDSAVGAVGDFTAVAGATSMLGYIPFNLTGLRIDQTVGTGAVTLAILQGRSH